MSIEAYETAAIDAFLQDLHSNAEKIGFPSYTDWAQEEQARATERLNEERNDQKDRG